LIACPGHLWRQVTARLHLGKVDGWRRSRRFDARDEHDWATRAKLDARTRLKVRCLSNAATIHESAEARIGVNDQATPVLETKLRVAARDHRPLGLIEYQMALGRVAPDLDSRVVVNTLLLWLPVTLFYQNDSHNSHPDKVIGDG
jgi:hypothetical protein